MDRLTAENIVQYADVYPPERVAEARRTLTEQASETPADPAVQQVDLGTGSAQVPSVAVEQVALSKPPTGGAAIAQQFAPVRTPVSGSLAALPSLPVTATAGIVSGAYHTLTGQERNRNDALAEDYRAAGWMPFRLSAEGFDTLSFINAGQEYYVRKALYRNHGTQDPGQIPADVYAEYRRQGDEYARREMARAMHAGASFVQTAPHEVTAARDFTNTYLPEGSWQRDAATGLLTYGTAIYQAAHAGLAALAAAGEVGTAEEVADLDLVAPDGYSEDPVGIASLALDTLIAATTSEGRFVTEPYGTVMVSPGGTVNPIMRFVGGGSTTLASMLAWSREGVDPRSMAATDYSLMEEGFIRGKEAAIAAGADPDSWVVPLVGYAVGAAGLTTDFAIPGPEVAAIPALRGLHYAVDSGMVSPMYLSMRSAARTVRRATDADEALAAVMATEKALGPEPAAKMRQEIGTSLGGKDADNLWNVRGEAYQRVSEAKAEMEAAAQTTDATRIARATRNLQAAEEAYRAADDAYGAIEVATGRKARMAANEALGKGSKRGVLSRALQDLERGATWLRNATEIEVARKMKGIGVADAWRTAALNGKRVRKYAIQNLARTATETQNAITAAKRSYPMAIQTFLDDVQAAKPEAATVATLAQQAAALAITTGSKTLARAARRLSKTAADLRAAEATEATASAAFDKFRVEAAENLERRLREVADVPRRWAEWMDSTAEAYRATGIGRAPDEVLDLMVHRGVVPDRDAALRALDSADLVIKAYLDPRHVEHLTGVSSFRYWWRRALWTFRQLRNPLNERYGPLDAEMQRAALRSERLFRAAVDDGLHIMADTFEDEATRLVRLDEWLTLGKPVGFGGQLLGRFGSVFRGWMRTRAPEVRIAGYTVANRIQLKDAQGGGVVDLSLWDAMLRKYRSADGSLTPDELADRNPDLDGLAKMWIGGVTVSPDALTILRAKATALLREPTMTPATMRAEMRAVTWSLMPDAVDRNASLVGIRFGRAVAYAAATERFITLMEEAAGFGYGRNLMADMRAVLEGRFYDVANLDRARRGFERLGVSSALPAGHAGGKEVSSPPFAEMGAVSKGAPQWVTAEIGARWSAWAQEFVKSHRMNVKEGGGTVSKVMSAFGSIWARDMTFGLLYPDAGHHLANLVGTTIQVWMESNLAMSAGVVWRSAFANVPLLNRWMQARRRRLVEQLGGPVLLPDVWHGLFHPTVDAIMRGGDGTVQSPSGASYTFEQIRNMWIEGGVFATHPASVNFSDIPGLRTGTTSLIRGYTEALGDIGTTIQARQRALLFTDELMRTGDPEGAARVVRAAMYDYVMGMTEAERVWVRAVVPFWNFWRNALAQSLSIGMQFVTHPTWDTVTTGRMAKLRQMVAAKRALMNLLEPSDEREQLRYHLAPDYAADRLKIVGEVPPGARAYIQQYLGESVDSYMILFAPDQITDTLNLLYSPFLLMLGLAVEADGGVGGVRMADGWEENALEPLSGQLNPFVKALLAGAAEAGNVEIGERLYDKAAPPTIVAVENRFRSNFLTYKDPDTGRPRLPWYTSLMVRGAPLVASAISLSDGVWFRNLGRIPWDNRTAPGQVMSSFTRSVPSALLSLFRMQPRGYSAAENQERFGLATGRALVEQKGRWEQAIHPEERPTVGQIAPWESAP
jgi:hypothetical protein